MYVVCESVVTIEPLGVRGAKLMGLRGNWAMLVDGKGKFFAFNVATASVRTDLKVFPEGYDPLSDGRKLPDQFQFSQEELELLDHYDQLDLSFPVERFFTQVAELIVKRLEPTYSRETYQEEIPGKHFWNKPKTVEKTRKVQTGYELPDQTTFERNHGIRIPDKVLELARLIPKDAMYDSWKRNDSKVKANIAKMVDNLEIANPQISPHLPNPEYPNWLFSEVTRIDRKREYVLRTLIQRQVGVKELVQMVKSNFICTTKVTQLYGDGAWEFEPSMTIEEFLRDLRMKEQPGK